ncbi:hypothetical protein KP509_27G041700 [Ceratopteris richardii]|uniref:Fungal lipase-type domain-containing protein n=1 Tax=Ceratopteris richardii TaxID=49495 RepID=A0A8T2RFU0_CERRI|nr:hypothetical protein KP509_27G041700 [Ceratopteris richardii]
MCRIVLAVYEDDLENPKWPPEGGYRMSISCVIKRAVYTDTEGRVPPYLIYVDHNAKDIVLAIRGLNLAKEKDYRTLFDNKPGKEKFDCGFVHCGLMKAAEWLVEKEADRLKGLLSEYPSYKLSIAGHSLGSGVAALFTMIVAKNGSLLGNIDRESIRCFAIAPARCMSLNLALLHADIIYSVILQDDFLPRTVTPVEDIFKSIFWIDRMPPFVRRAVPVKGRFEHVILSFNATKDHSLIWIEKESEKALEILREETDDVMEIPKTQKMSRRQTMKQQHKAALEKAQTLHIIDSFSEDNKHGISSENEDQKISSINEQGIEVEGKCSA